MRRSTRRKYIGKTTFIDRKYAVDRAQYLRMSGDTVKIKGKTVFIYKRKKKKEDLLA
jgi:hypothetical protein